MNKLKAVYSSFLELLWPSRCVACNRAGHLLCPYCKRELFKIDQKSACTSCGAPYGSLVCTECKKDWACKRAVCACAHDGIAQAIITSYKDFGEQRLYKLIAAYMYEAYIASQLVSESHNFVTYIPASKSALKRRGFDHMKLIAHEFSCLSNISVCVCLQKKDNKDQRTLSKLERKENMKDAFIRISSVNLVEAERVLLLDDVITTGATINEAAVCLKEGGACRVDVLAFSRVW